MPFDWSLREGQIGNRDLKITAMFSFEQVWDRMVWSTRLVRACLGLNVKVNLGTGALGLLRTTDSCLQENFYGDLGAAGTVEFITTLIVSTDWPRIYRAEGSVVISKNLNNTASGMIDGDMIELAGVIVVQSESGLAGTTQIVIIAGRKSVDRCRCRGCPMQYFGDPSNATKYANFINESGTSSDYFTPAPRKNLANVQWPTPTAEA
jgi:hypothetical protein